MRQQGSVAGVCCLSPPTRVITLKRLVLTPGVGAMWSSGGASRGKGFLNLTFRTATPALVSCGRQITQWRRLCGNLVSI